MTMMNLLAQQKINLQPQTGEFQGLGGLTVPAIISGLIRFTVVVAAIVFFFILVLGGIKWIASGGDKQQTETARNQITAALVGLVIVFAAWAIVALINTFFNIDIFSLTLPSVTGK
jgi:TRAP-type C4-dicarboxylate transport system permease small subunit